MLENTAYPHQDCNNQNTLHIQLYKCGIQQTKKIIRNKSQNVPLFNVTFMLSILSM